MAAFACSEKNGVIVGCLFGCFVVLRKMVCCLLLVPRNMLLLFCCLLAVCLVLFGCLLVPRNMVLLLFGCLFVLIKNGVVVKLFVYDEISDVVVGRLAVCELLRVCV